MPEKKIRNNILLLCILTFSVFIFTSCLSAASTLTIKPDGSGTLILDYSIMKEASGIQKDSSFGEGRLIPLPISEEDFLGRVSQLFGILLVNLQSREDLDYTYIDSEIEFASIRDLSLMVGIPLELNENGREKILTITIVNQELPVLPDTRKYLTSLVIDETLSFNINIPGSIRESTYGQISSNSRSVTYSLPLEELYSNNNFIWDIEWD